MNIDASAGVREVAPPVVAAVDTVVDRLNLGFPQLRKVMTRLKQR